MIRKALPTDFNFIYTLYMHPQVNPYLLYEQMPEIEFEPIYQKLLDAEIKYVFEENGTVKGMFKLVPQHYRSDHVVYLGGLAVSPAFGREGTGSRMLGEIIDFAKQRSYLRIELSVATYNARAIKLYERHGFQQEGVLRKLTHLKSENRFIDEILMSVLL